MKSLVKVVRYVNNTKDLAVLKDYFTLCRENYDKVTKQVNLFSNLAFLVIVLYVFPKPLQTLKLWEVEFNLDVVRLLTPLLLSFFVFKWLMLSKRRRDLLVAMQQSSHILYQIEPDETERFFPAFDPNVLNLLPFSLISEISNIDLDRKFNLWMIRTGLFFMVVFITGVLCCALWQSVEAYHLVWRFIWPRSIKDFVDLASLYATLIVSVFFVIWIVFYYYVECSNLKEIKAMANKAKE